MTPRAASCHGTDASRPAFLDPLNSDSGYLHLKAELRSVQLPMTDDLTSKIVAWATEIARYAAALPSREQRESYLVERHRELVAGAVAEGAAQGDALVLADACVNAAQRIMTELLAQRAGLPQGRA
jgi:hypothetical protein